MTLRKYLILLAVMVFGSSGDVCLSRGMRDFGAVSRSNVHLLLNAILTPWVIGGICLLILFFCSYLTALSWADLTYVVPATAFSYVIMAALARIFLHENVPLEHWLGIGLITVGVGFVATGPSLTERGHSHAEEEIAVSKTTRSDA